MSASNCLTGSVSRPTDGSTFVSITSKKRCLINRLNTVAWLCPPFARGRDSITAATTAARPRSTAPCWRDDARRKPYAVRWDDPANSCNGVTPLHEFAGSPHLTAYGFRRASSRQHGAVDRGRAAVVAAVIESRPRANGGHSHATVFNRLIRQRFFDVIETKVLPSVGLLTEPVKQLLADIADQAIFAERSVEHRHRNQVATRRRISRSDHAGHA